MRNEPDIIKQLRDEESQGLLDIKSEKITESKSNSNILKKNKVRGKSQNYQHRQWLRNSRIRYPAYLRTVFLNQGENRCRYGAGVVHHLWPGERIGG